MYLFKRKPQKPDFDEHSESSGSGDDLFNDSQPNSPIFNARQDVEHERKFAQQFDINDDYETYGQNRKHRMILQNKTRKALDLSDNDNMYDQDSKIGSVAPIARIKNPIMFQRVKLAIQSIKHRRLTFGETAALRQFIDGLAAHKLQHYSDIEIEQRIVNEFIKATSDLNNEDGEIDMHAILSKQIGLNGENDVVNASLNKMPTTSVIANAVDLSSVLGNNDKYGIQSIINPHALLTKTRILLDSRNRSLDTDGTSLIKWSFSNTIGVQQGTFNSTSPIRDIVSIKVLPFKIPYTATAENPTNNISMYFNEFSNQCVIAPENGRYHHWFSYVQEGDWLSLNAYDYNKGIYNFDKPITTLDTLSVSFGAPLASVVFDIDRLNATITTGNPTTLTFAQNHNIQTGNTIYFTNFTTSNTSSDATQIAAMNSIYGLEVTRISATVVTVPVDTSTLVGTVNSPTAFFGEKRIYINLELTYIKPKN